MLSVDQEGWYLFNKCLKDFDVNSNAKSCLYVEKSELDGKVTIVGL